MKNVIFLILSLITYWNVAQSQDTICIDKRSEYFSETDTIGILSKKGKGIYNKAKYVREFIQFSETKGKIERCFYYDDQRFTNRRTTTFNLENDNEIIVREHGFSETWIYQKVNNNRYQIVQQLGNIKEIGYARSLMPLEKVGDFYAIGSDGDTLYSFQYDRYILTDSIKINTDTTCNREIDFCETEDLKELYKHFNNHIGRNYRMPSVDSHVLTSVFIEFSISENGEVCNIGILKSHGNPFLEKAVLNVFGKKGFKYLAAEFSNCKVRFFLKEPYFLH